MNVFERKEEIHEAFKKRLAFLVQGLEFGELL